MRRVFAAIVMIGLPLGAAAQSPVPLADVSPTLPPIGFPLPPIGLPLPAIGLPPLAEPQTRMGDGRPSRAPENQPSRNGSRRGGRSVPTFVYLVPPYGWGYEQPVHTTQSMQTGQSVVSAGTVPIMSSDDRRPTGRVRLDVHPESERLQLYVDGFYIGTSDDLDDELELEAGAHRIEIHATGYETLTFDVKIAAQRSITYQGTLKSSRAKTEPAGTEPTAPAPTTAPRETPAVAAPVTPTTIYFIPGCYLGNVPPEEVALPATCDLSRLVVSKPSPPQR